MCCHVDPFGLRVVHSSLAFGFTAFFAFAGGEAFGVLRLRLEL